jgi:hypothetical protein
MSSLARQSLAPGRRSDRGFSRSFVAFLLTLRAEWGVRRQVACAQMLDCASLRDIGLAPGGVESAIRHGRGGRVSS